MNVIKSMLAIASLLEFTLLWSEAHFLLAEDSTTPIPLHQKINQVLGESEVGPRATLATDGEFLRRIRLDLTGTIPNTKEVRVFLADSDPQKRRKKIEELLNSPAYVLHLSQQFDLMFMERRAAKHVTLPEWNAYLLQSFKENKPYNQLAKEILGADGSEGPLRAAVRFYLDRDAETNLLTRDVARVFFGRDLQCAQCHDHPQIDDYYQKDYYGIYSFLNRSFLFQPDKKKKAIFAEKAESTDTYKSVFLEMTETGRPQLPGDEPITEPTFKKGEEYKVKPAKNVRPIPNFSRKEEFARLVFEGKNRAFNENIVNRLWALMLGRGLVHPVDLHHEANPPVNPRLLQLLAEEFPRMKYDIKAMLKEIALSEVYQRSIDFPQQIEAEVAKGAELEKATADRLKEKTTQFHNVSSEVSHLQEKIEQTQTEQQKLRKEVSSVIKQLESAINQTVEAKQEMLPLREQEERLATTLSEMQTALEKLKSAEKSFVSDKPTQQELQKLIQTTTGILQKKGAEEQSLKKQITTQEMTIATLETKLKEVQNKDKSLVQKTAALKATLKSDQEHHVSLISKRETLQVQKLELENAFAMYSLLSSVHEETSRWNKARDQLTSLQSEMQSMSVQKAKLDAQLQQQKGLITKHQQQQTEMQQAISSLDNSLKQQQSSVSTLSEANSLLQKTPLLQQDSDSQAVLKTLEELQSKYLSQEKAMLSQKSTTEAKRTELQQQIQQQLQMQTQLEQQLQSTLATIKQKQPDVKELGQECEACHLKLETARADLVEQSAKQFLITNIEPLSPEQIGWSIFQVTGLIDQYRISVTAEFNKKAPLTEAQQQDAKFLQERSFQIELEIRKKLAGPLAQFIQLFGAAAGQPQSHFFATADQALFLSNAGQLQGWLAQRGANLTARLLKIQDAHAYAEELYLSVLTRKPTLSETQEVQEYLKTREKDRFAAASELIWALVTSTEFRFHH